MMKVLRITARFAAVLLLTYLFTRLWLQSSGSERLWTWLNSRLTEGADPGLASDIELLIALAGALTGAIVVVYSLLTIWETVVKGGRS